MLVLGPMAEICKKCSTCQHTRAHAHAQIHHHNSSYTQNLPQNINTHRRHILVAGMGMIQNLRVPLSTTNYSFNLLLSFHRSAGCGPTHCGTPDRGRSPRFGQSKDKKRRSAANTSVSELFEPAKMVGWLVEVALQPWLIL